jgi:hypothetical protein
MRDHCRQCLGLLVDSSKDGAKLELAKDAVLTVETISSNLPWPEGRAVEEGST